MTTPFRAFAAILVVAAACRSSAAPVLPDPSPDAGPEDAPSASFDASADAAKPPPPPPAEAGAALPEIERTVTALRGRYRRCLAQGLATSPNLPSAIDVTIDIGATGRPVRVDVSSRPASSPLSPEARRCIEDSTKTARFPAPDGGVSTLKIPMRITGTGP